MSGFQTVELQCVGPGLLMAGLLLVLVRITVCCLLRRSGTGRVEGPPPGPGPPRCQPGPRHALPACDALESGKL